jgi:hypothetical protein
MLSCSLGHFGGIYSAKGERGRARMRRPQSLVIRSRRCFGLDFRTFVSYFSFIPRAHVFVHYVMPDRFTDSSSAYSDLVIVKVMQLL